MLSQAVITPPPLSLSAVFSMEAHPRTPNTEPLYSQIVQPPSGATHPNRPHATSTPAPLPVATQRHSTPRNSRNSDPRRPHPVLRPSRVAPPISSSGVDADIDTDDVDSEVAGRGRRPWYHVSASEFNEVVRQPTPPPAQATSEGVSDNDDTSRMDPSGISTASTGQSDVEERGVKGGDGGSCEGERRREGEGRRRREEEGGRGDGRRERWSRDSVEGSLCVQTSQSGSREKRLSLADLDPTRCHGEGDATASGDPTEMPGQRQEELDDIQTRLSSPQPSADPMWYRRGSGCEETDLAAVLTTDKETGQQTAIATGMMSSSSPQKSVTWADQELGTRGANPRHSCDSYTSSLSSRSIRLEPPSAASSHEGSPTPTLTPGYPGGFPGGVVSVATPPMTSRRPLPDGGGVVVFPHHHTRQLSGSIPPSSPTSLLSSGSNSQHWGQGSAAPQAARCVSL